jgi:uncharacterized Zn-finger protein
MSNLDSLILDCLEAYADDNIPLTIDSSSAQSAQSDKSIDVTFLPEQRLFEMQPMLVSPATSVFSSPIQSTQWDKFADIPFIFPKQNLFFDSMGLISPVSPLEESAAASKSRIKCSQCGNSYLGSRQLTRHMKKHNEPNKYSCTVAGCKQKTYRVDGMRSHIRAHEQRVLKDELKVLINL